MAFQNAVGYNNLPNGVFSPTIYSKKVQMAFRKSAVAQAITNNDYFGEIANFGDSVRIIKEPEVTIFDYARGSKVVPQDLIDSDFTLTIDRARAWAFKMDDIEESMSHVNWASLAQSRAAYRLADNFDADILGYMSGYDYAFAAGTPSWAARTTTIGTKANAAAGTDELLTSQKLTKSAFSTSGTGTYSVPVGVQGTYDATPLQVLNRMNRILDQQNVPNDNRYIVVDPIFVELLSDENSKLVNNDYMSGQNAGGQLTNGQLVANKIRGFTVYQSNNLPSIGTGPGTISTTGSASNFGVLIAGHKSAVATAEQMAKLERMRSPDTFGDIVRGMHRYGRKILRPEGIVVGLWNKSQ